MVMEMVNRVKVNTVANSFRFCQNYMIFQNLSDSIDIWIKAIQKG